MKEKNQSFEPFASSAPAAADVADGSSSSGFLERITTPSSTPVVGIHSFVANYYIMFHTLEFRYLFVIVVVRGFGR